MIGGVKLVILNLFVTSNATQDVNKEWASSTAETKGLFLIKGMCSCIHPKEENKGFQMTARLYR